MRADKLKQALNKISATLQDQYTISDREMCEKIVNMANEALQQDTPRYWINVQQLVKDTINSIEGTEVYHVAHPDVRGCIKTVHNENTVGVMFDYAISFSGNSSRGEEYYWDCSTNLLFPSPEMAHKNHDPERAKGL